VAACERRAPRWSPLLLVPRAAAAPGGLLADHAQAPASSEAPAGQPGTSSAAAFISRSSSRCSATSASSAASWAAGRAASFSRRCRISAACGGSGGAREGGGGAWAGATRPRTWLQLAGWPAGRGFPPGR
jgi:hypothetical protein